MGGRIRISDVKHLTCSDTFHIEYDTFHTKYRTSNDFYHIRYDILDMKSIVTRQVRGGGLGSRPKKMYEERLGDGVEYHLMSPTPRR